MNYYALDEALEMLDENKMLDYMQSTGTLVQISNSIRVMKKKLSELKTKEEKKAYLEKNRAGAKRGMTWRQNQHPTNAYKRYIAKQYDRLFKFIDDELAKLK